MKKSLELTSAEQRFLKRMKSRVRMWPFFRWVGLAAGSILVLVGVWGVCISFRATVRSDPEFISVASAMVAVLSLAVFTFGFVLLAYVISRWDCNHRDSMLIKLLEANGDDSHKDKLGSSS